MNVSRPNLEEIEFLTILAFTHPLEIFDVDTGEGDRVPTRPNTLEPISESPP